MTPAEDTGARGRDEAASGDDAFVVPPRPPLPQPSTTAPSRWPLVAAVVGAVAVVALAVAAALVAIPAVLANSAAEASDGSVPFTLRDGPSEARLTVPAGWVVIRAADDAVVVRTPDDGMSVRVTVVTQSATSAMDELIAAEPSAAAVQDVHTEVLASGLPVAHADVTGVVDDVLAVVTIGEAAGESPVVTLVADIAEQHDVADYRPALAALIEGVAR